MQADQSISQRLSARWAVEQSSAESAAAKVAQQGMRKSQQLTKVIEKSWFLWCLTQRCITVCSSQKHRHMTLRAVLQRLFWFVKLLTGGICSPQPFMAVGISNVCCSLSQ